MTNTCHSYIEAAGLSGEQLRLSFHEQEYMERMLYDGYFAFEALSEHDWDKGVCGICRIAPVFGSGDDNAKNCTPLKKGEVSIHILALGCNSMVMSKSTLLLHVWKILLLLVHVLLHYLLKLQIRWPADVDSVADDVDVDEWWESVDMRIVEQVAISGRV